MQPTNKVSLSGVLKTTPELREYAPGKHLCTFEINQERPYKGEVRVETYQLKCWSKTALFVSGIPVGSELLADGVVNAEKWTNAKGIDIAKISITALKVTLVAPPTINTENPIDEVPEDIFGDRNA
jgi:single-stranded DNA-binding protein